MAFRILALICIGLCRAYPAEKAIAGSVLGFLFDPATGLQPIRGTPGAATIGPPLSLDTEVSGVSLSPRQNHALATRLSDSNLLLINFAEPVSVRPLAVPIAGSGLIAFSPNGSAVAIQDRERNRILVLSGLPEAVTLANEFDLSSFTGLIESIAISDGAESVLLSSSEKVIGLGADGSFTSIESLNHASAMTFLNNSRDAVIADSASHTVYLVRNVTGSPETTVLLSEILEPVVVAVSNENKRVFVASSLTGTISEVELSSGSVTVTSCPCRPSALTPLNGNAVFRLTEPNGSAVWLFDGDGAQRRTVFVPPYRPLATEEPAQ